MKRKLSSIAAAALVLGTLAPAAFADSSTSTYSDISGNFAAQQITQLTTSGYIHGFSDGTFRPNDSMSRGQFLAYFMNAVESITGVKPSAAAQYYSDIAPGNWGFNYVGAAQEAHWINPYWINVKVGYDFNENFHASYGDAASFFVAAMEAAGKLSSSDLNGMAPLAYAKSIGLFQGIPSTENQTYLDRASGAVVLSNILAWANGQLLPSGDTVSVSAQSSMAPNSNQVLSATVKDASGKVVTLPSTAVPTFSVDNSNGFIVNNNELVVTQPGVYNVTATVDGVKSAGYAVTVFGQAAGVKVVPASTTLVANNKSTVVANVYVLDANGATVGNYNGTVDVTDTAGLLWNSTSTTSTKTLLAVPVTNGMAQVTLQAGNIVGLTDTITATDVKSGNTVLNNAANQEVSATATISTTAQVATALSVTSSAKYIANNQTGSGSYTAGQATINATVLDQTGNPMLSGNYPITFAISGPATSTYSTSTAQIGNTPATFVINSEQGVAGAVTVTASSPNLTSSSATVQAVTVGAVKSVSLTQTASTFSADVADATGGADTITVQALDANGYPTTYNGTLNVALTSGGTASTGLTVPTSVTLVNGVGTLTVTGTTYGGANTTAVGTYTVTVTDPNNVISSQSANVVVTAGAAAVLSFSSPSHQTYVGATNPVTPVTVQVSDKEGNAVADGGVTVTFATYQSGGSYNFPATLSATSAVTNAQGQATVTLTAGPYTSNSYYVTAAATGSGLTSATSPMITVNNTVASTVTASLTDAKTGAGQATAGDTLTLAYQGLNQYNQAVAGDTFTLKLSGIAAKNNGQTVTSQVYAPTGVTVNSDGSLTGTVTALNALTFVAQTSGIGSVVVTDNTAPTSPSATATISIGAGAQVGYAFFDAAGHNLAWNSANQYDSFAPGTPVQVWLKPVDAEGNATTVASSNSVTVTVYTQGGMGSFRLSAGGADVGTISLSAASAGQNLYFINDDSSAEYINLTAK